jgi:hypothetical protein
MSDCLFRWIDNLPGCPEPLSGMLKQLYDRKLAISQACLHIRQNLNLRFSFYLLLIECWPHRYNSQSESMHDLLDNAFACTHVDMENDLML